MNREKYIKRHKQTSINITNTQVDSIRNKDITRIGYRIYDEGCIGIAGAIGNQSDEVLEAQAIANLDLKIPYTYPLSSKKQMQQNYIEDTTSIAQVLKDVEEIMVVLKEEYPDFIISNKVNIEEVETSLSSDQDLELVHKDRHFEWDLVIREHTSINIFDTGIGGACRKWNKTLLLNEIKNHLIAYRNKMTLPEGEKLPIVFMGGDLLLLLSKVMDELNGYKIGSKASLFTTFMGEQKFNKQFSLYQDHSKDSFLSVFNMEPFFDMEGVVHEDFTYPLIEQGKLVSAYTDKKTAAKFNMPLTGAASASYDGVPTLGTPPVTIRSSGKTLKELLEGQLGLVIIMAAGGDYTPEGKFATPVQLAMLTDGEKLLGRVPEFEISGHMYEIFGEDFVGYCADKPFNGMHALVANMNIRR